MNISEEAVEAAAASLLESLRGDGMGYVDASDPKDVVIDIRDFNLPEAVRKALEAAAPHLHVGDTEVAFEDDDWNAVDQ